VERRMRLLRGLRHHTGVLDGEEASLVRERAVLGPRADHDGERLLEALAVLLLRDVVAPELGGAVAAADADVEPPLRDDVDQPELFGEPQWMMERQDRGG